MKNLVLSMSGAILLAVQVNAQQPSVTVNSNTNASNTKNVSYSYTVNDVKNSVNVRYNDSGSNQDVKDDPMRSKTFSKSFTADRNDKVNLSNQYGSITIKVWNKNEIKVDADIKAYAKTEDEAQKLLDDVEVTATKTGDLVTYKTSMGERNGNWGSSVRNGKTIWRREVKTHYIVYMPAANALTATQQYGNIIMDDFAGPTSIKVQYGNLTAGNLSNANNYISIQYGKATVKDMGGARIKHQYGGGFTMGTVDDLDLDAQYTSVNVAAVKGSATVKHQYGSGTTIGQVGNLNVNTQYTTIKIGALHGNIVSKAQYGKVIVDEIDAGKSVAVNAQYTSVNLGFSANYNGDFEVRTNYGSFKYPSTVTVKRDGDDRSYSSSKNYTGQIGKGGAATVNIDLQYNSVTFK